MLPALQQGGGRSSHAAVPVHSFSRPTPSPYLDLPVLALAVQRVQDLVGDFGDVDGHVQSADDAVVAVRQAVLDVVQGGVDQYAVVVPGSALSEAAAGMGSMAVSWPRVDMRAQLR